MQGRPHTRTPFSERDFYLAEFRGRTLAIAFPQKPALDDASRAVVEEVLRELAANGTPVILVGDDQALIEGLAAGPVVDARGPTWVGGVWRVLQQHPSVGVATPPGEGLAGVCARIATELKLAKLIWLGSEGVLWLSDQRRRSLVDLEAIDLCANQAEAQGIGGKDVAELLREIKKMLAGGVASVSACLPIGLADELFTYAGSGTFYSPAGHTEVRSLALDEFDAAENLIMRGVEEGYLLERSGFELERVLTHGFGAFVEGRYLAGIAALLPHVDSEAGEISSLYALTRFLGEGVGGQLVEFAARRASAAGMQYVFACTTSERVEAFFLRAGFRLVARDEIPESKWSDYSQDRLDAVRCLKRDLT